MTTVKRKVTNAVNRLLNPLGLTVDSYRKTDYCEDGLRSIHNSDFSTNPKFKKAYARGVAAAGRDYNWKWRVHTGLWAASQAAALPNGDFVECGVNRGFLSSAIMDYLDWNNFGRNFYLYDTFCGLVPNQINAEESSLDRLKQTQRLYTDCYADARKNFEEYRNVHLIKGEVPASLPEANVESVAYLSLDMNCAHPEIAALDYFWPKLVKGGIVLLDDFAYRGFEPQHKALCQHAKENNLNILALPTGQGLIIKP